MRRYHKETSPYAVPSIKVALQYSLASNRASGLCIGRSILEYTKMASSMSMALPSSQSPLLSEKHPFCFLCSFIMHIANYNWRHDSALVPS